MSSMLVGRRPDVLQITHHDAIKPLVDLFGGHVRPASHRAIARFGGVGHWCRPADLKKERPESAASNGRISSTP